MFVTGKLYSQTVSALLLTHTVVVVMSSTGREQAQWRVYSILTVNVRLETRQAGVVKCDQPQFGGLCEYQEVGGLLSLLLLKSVASTFCCLLRDSRVVVLATVVKVLR